MKKRYHSNQSIYQLNLYGRYSDHSNRSLRFSQRSVSEKISGELAKSSQKMSEMTISPLSEWGKEEAYDLKLTDEISENELKGFAFGCITSLAHLTQAGKQSIEQALTDTMERELTSFVSLVQESEEAQREFTEYYRWSKKLISTTQPLLGNSNAPADELTQLRAQVMQCAERSMGKKYRAESLRKRIDFLIESVSEYVASTGVELGMPKLVMKKVSKALRGVLTAVSK